VLNVRIWFTEVSVFKPRRLGFGVGALPFSERHQVRRCLSPVTAGYPSTEEPMYKVALLPLPSATRAIAIIRQYKQSNLSLHLKDITGPLFYMLTRFTSPGQG
jgi:hypothetical protein